MRDFYEDLWERLPEQLVPPDLELRLAHLRAGVRAGDRVLDLGCGDGRFTAELARVGAAPTGVDIAEAALTGPAPPTPTSTSGSRRSTGRSRSTTARSTSCGPAR